MTAEQATLIFQQARRPSSLPCWASPSNWPKGSRPRPLPIPPRPRAKLRLRQADRQGPGQAQGGQARTSRLSSPDAAPDRRSRASHAPSLSQVPRTGQAVSIRADPHHRGHSRRPLAGRHRAHHPSWRRDRLASQRHDPRVVVLHDDRSDLLPDRSQSRLARLEAILQERVRRRVGHRTTSRGAIGRTSRSS